MKVLVLILAVAMLAKKVYSQSTVDTPDLQRLTDEFFASPDEDLNYQELYENAVQLLSSPFDLNSVSSEELKTLHILTGVQIENFMTYRRKQGSLLDVHELQVIPGFDPEVIDKLLLFVRVVDPSAKRSLLASLFAGGHSYLVTRLERTLETKKGSRIAAGKAPAFRGSSDRLYFRFRSSVPGNFSIGLTGEKDAGEKMALDPARHQWGFDFTSAHIQVRNRGRLKNLVVGDFQAQFGQGLLFGGAFGFGKGGESISTIRKSNVGFQPYTSINESTFQRGLALTYYPKDHIGLSVFYSQARRDASTEQESDTTEVRSFQSTGYHRTESEWQKRKNVVERNAGVVVHLTTHRLDAGVVANIIHFNTAVQKRPNLYNQFAFEGTKNINTGIFLNYRLGNISFFSEWARSLGSGGMGCIAGLLLSAHARLDFSILHRHYHRNFYTFYSNAISESSQPQNEQGLYWGWKYRWTRALEFNGYFDLFTFPWLGFRRYSPSGGYEWLVRSQYKPSRRSSIVIVLREESKEVNRSGDMPVYKLDVRRKRTISFHCNYGPQENILLRSRIQYNVQHFDGGTTEGWAFVLDAAWASGKFQISARHGLFDTDHYDNRHYVYESDAWSSYSLPAYSGIGVRNYLLIEYKLNKHVTLWGRYARTRMLNEDEIGTGPDAIEGNTRNDVKFQARINF